MIESIVNAVLGLFALMLLATLLVCGWKIFSQVVTDEPRCVVHTGAR